MLGGSNPAAGGPGAGPSVGPFYGMPQAPSGTMPPPAGPAPTPQFAPAPPVSGWAAPSSVVAPFVTPPAGPDAPAGTPPSHDTPPPLFGPSDEDGATRFLGGVDLGKLRIPKYTYVLQILDLGGQWRDWGPIHASGMNVGRAKSSADFPGLSTMAVKHMKFRYEKTTLMVEDLGSLNGIYLRVTQPVTLIDGMRFRVGNQTIEFHAAEPFDAVPPLMAEDGEEYCSRDLEPLACLDLIRPNGRPGLRFPITRPDPTVIGREGPSTHIALTNDSAVSGKHAQIHREDGNFILEDLRSRNGTFVHILGAHPVKSGDVLLAGRVLFRVLDQSAG
jgi:pSer/pThr/pTyr-binding forkhead associated (FHA) protein